jgi:hypothetical protein
MMAGKILELLKKVPRQTFCSPAAWRKRHGDRLSAPGLAGLIVPPAAPYFEALGARGTETRIKAFLDVMTITGIRLRSLPEQVAASAAQTVSSRLGSLRHHVQPVKRSRLPIPASPSTFRPWEKQPHKCWPPFYESEGFPPSRIRQPTKPS